MVYLSSMDQIGLNSWMGFFLMTGHCIACDIDDLEPKHTLYLEKRRQLTLSDNVKLCLCLVKC